mmetsp:Transcript_5304/g.7283  ORF Transcript_5304/g.7283 Transcript_5304/m.7283 type:complete len:372 (-) Transcript_5304:149-1264(-)|eukprot:CAMPEP_0185733144 /NCGR_PEP_ID=MMETSP1171-20130828/18537_1 /TAXON_ID=374046 /ORGANISM="Helicotheca tamensis, Strain CCMP826" /LENGTH=371 /DNA_ID=CAMNT_0028402781 /DNA_START=103 /DNA_END=1218 /DNA_ORIENTATION=+
MQRNIKGNKSIPVFRALTRRTVFIFSSLVGVVLVTNKFFGVDENITASDSIRTQKSLHSWETPTEDPDPSAPWPRVTWLMSFPNSGTSYTMMMTQRLTNLTVASNYGKECFLDEDEKTVPVHADSPNGPYLLRPLSKELPKKYILTKTHCIGFETAKPPSSYIQTHRTFVKGCARGSRFEGEEKENVYYDEKIVQRAIHLLRNPFNNAVSRFHLQQHEKSKAEEKEWLEKYPSTPEGFQTWCGDLDKMHETEDKESRFFDEEINELFKGVPCHAEFVEYAQWHRLALDTTRDLKLPTLVLHYEDYGSDHKATVGKVLDFLELEAVNELKPFITGKSYDEYFSHEQRVKAMKLIKALVNPDTWKLLERYDVN